MIDILKERKQTKERQAYYNTHKEEYPFPLDGTDWAREIREHQFLDRHPHCRCESCQNFLTRLHAKDSLLFRQRTVIPRAMHHWFLHKVQTLYWMSDQLTAEELAKLALRFKNENTEYQNLIKAEESWLAHKTYAQRTPCYLKFEDTPETIAMLLKLAESLETEKPLAIETKDRETLLLEVSKTNQTEGQVTPETSKHKEASSEKDKNQK